MTSLSKFSSRGDGAQPIQFGSWRRTPQPGSTGLTSGRPWEDRRVPGLLAGRRSDGRTSVPGWSIALAPMPKNGSRDGNRIVGVMGPHVFMDR